MMTLRIIGLGLCLLVLGGTGPASGTEYILLPYGDGGLRAPFSQARVQAFLTTIRWVPAPTLTYEEILEQTGFLYDYYKRVLQFTDDEIAALRKADREAEPGTLAYVLSRDPITGAIRGVIRIAASAPMQGAAVVWRDRAPVPLPVAKYPGVGAFIAERYPTTAVEMGRFASHHSSPPRRLFILTQMVRAALLFLHLNVRNGDVLVESTPVTVDLYELLGLQYVPEAPMPPGRFLMAATTRRGIDTLFGPVEWAGVMPDGVDALSDEGAALVRARLEAVDDQLPRGLRRYVGSVPYHRALVRLQLGDAAGALRDVEVLKGIYGDEAEVLSLELEVIARAHVDFWRGTGDVAGLVAFLTDPANVARFDRQRMADIAPSWEEHPYWLALAHLAGGHTAAARAVREELLVRDYGSYHAGLVSLEALGAGEAERHLTPSARRGAGMLVPTAQYLHRSPPLALSARFTRACAGLLRQAGDPLAAHFEARAAALGP